MYFTSKNVITKILFINIDHHKPLISGDTLAVTTN